MKQSKQADRRSIGWLTLVLSSAMLAGAEPTLGQIRPDATLPNRSAARTQGNRVVITGGTRSGETLFHSFRDFSIRRGRTASFRSIDPQVERIMTRVTGSAASRIEGRIEALQADGRVSGADFWLINPNGIWFGSNAALNLGGSFIATTAERLRFADGVELSAIDPVAPQLSISVPVGLQFGPNPAPIRNASIAPLRDAAGRVVLDPGSNQPFFGGLQLPQGRTLALIGGDLTFAGGVVTVPGGRVELGSVGSGGRVDLTRTDRGWRVSYPDPQFGQAIRFEGASLDVSDQGSGNMQIWGRSVLLTDESFLVADTRGDRDGGQIRVRATDLTLDNLSLIGSQTEEAGRTADIRLDVDRLRLTDGAFVAINTYGTGAGGNLIVNARESIELSGGIPNGEFWEASGLFNQVSAPDAPQVTGQGGNMNLTTRSLRVLEGAQINASTFAVGDAGSIQIRARQVDLDGVALERGELFTTGPRRLPIGSGIFAGTDRTASGNGGSLRLDTDRLRIRNGAVLQTTTFGSGDAGEMVIRATESIEVSGTDLANRFPSSLIAASGGIPEVLAEGVATASGRGGTLRLQTSALRVTDGGTIAVGSLNPNEQVAKGGGTATLQADSIELANQGRILTATASGDGGNMSVNVGERLTLRQNSQISTSAGSDRAGGDGGNIAIAADYILAALAENSDITANAYTGSGGNITITANGIFGITARDRLTAQSDITASSALGVNGTIQINAPDVDPSRGLTALPTTIVNAHLDQRCQPERDPATSRFVATGRGGLLPAPDRIEAGPAIWQDLRLPTDRSPADAAARSEQRWVLALDPPGSPLVEAQGWMIGATGDIVLTAQAPTVTPYGSWQSPASCDHRVSRE